MRPEWQEVFTDPKPVRYAARGFLWYRKAKCKHAQSALKAAMEDRTAGDVTVAHRLPSGGMWYANAHPASLAANLKDFDFNLHEMICTDAPRRAFFDIDCDTDDPADLEHRFLDLQQRARRAIADMFGGASAALSGSAGKKGDGWRLSLHIVVRDVVYRDHKHQTECNLEAAAALLASELGVEVDRAVYTANRAFKLPWQSKGGGDDRVQAALGSEPISDHFVTALLPLPKERREVRFTALPPPAAAPALARTRRTGASLPPWPLPVVLPNDWDIKGDAAATLELLKHSHDGPHRFSRRLRYTTMSWCKGRGLHFSQFVRWASQGRDMDAERMDRYRREWQAVNGA
eukprot:scaffold1354_cov14-Prasinocladus_malaysianus.AAC.1